MFAFSLTHVTNFWRKKLQIFLLICSHQVGIHNVQSQVVVNKPVPAVQAKAGAAFEDTMLLLEMVREKKQQEMKQIKVKQSSEKFYL